MPILTPNTAFAAASEPGSTCDARGIPVATSTMSALQPIGRQRRPSVRIATWRGSPASIRIAGTAMKVSAIVPPTQTVAART